jgi:metallo-beta-lactamase family protein
VLRRVLGRGGVAVVPAFAVGRAQLLLHLVEKLQAEGAVPRVPVYLDSPMATDVTALYARYPGQHRLSNAALAALRANTRIVNGYEESRALDQRHGPMVIVAGSGMITGGRVLHHLEAFAGDARNAVLLSGFQAGGTRGAALARGERILRIHRHDVAVHAEVVALEGASGHADADGLLAWLRSAPQAPEAVFLNHGEPDAADALRLRIERELGWAARVPDHLERVELSPAPVPRVDAPA